MAWTVPHTWADNEWVRAPVLNTTIRDNMLSANPVCGYVRNDGVPILGNRYSAIKNGTGDFSITWTAPEPSYNLVPVVNAQAVGYTAYMDELDAYHARVKIHDNGGAAVDAGFTFVAVPVADQLPSSDWIVPPTWSNGTLASGVNLNQDWRDDMSWAKGLAGLVNGNGTIAWGSGYTVSHTGTGQYRITWTGGGSVGWYLIPQASAIQSDRTQCYLNNFNQQWADLYFYKTGTGMVDVEFAFICKLAVIQAPFTGKSWNNETYAFRQLWDYTNGNKIRDDLDTVQGYSGYVLGNGSYGINSSRYSITRNSAGNYTITYVNPIGTYYPIPVVTPVGSAQAPNIYNINKPSFQVIFANGDYPFVFHCVTASL